MFSKVLYQLRLPLSFFGRSVTQPLGNICIVRLRGFCQSDDCEMIDHCSAAFSFVRLLVRLVFGHLDFLSLFCPFFSQVCSGVFIY